MTGPELQGTALFVIRNEGYRAAMRALAFAKLGEEIDLPEGLQWPPTVANFSGVLRAHEKAA
ncbi:hypothetical protein QLQ86_05240 [Halomonas sp. LR5S13]|uniref:hypothetical protein n=1 Tax=Halomonas rhizosphaerae TaxID=3043296 RepID=UPI0024A7DE06|nr:hypothetical protein [Halomonas rhizosphaerae]MDI5920188.1 hypothetical protein [Halomonas rhizosphaerae]